MFVKKSTLRTILKALGTDSQLEYFKKELIKILAKQESSVESDLKKALGNYESFFQIGHELVIEKGKVANVGETREWKGKKFRKIAPGKWRRIYEHEGRGAKQSIRILAKKIINAQSTDELLELINQNINRFTGEDGKLLPIVEELQKTVNEKKKQLNAGKPTTQKQIDDYNKQKVASEKKMNKKEHDDIIQDVKSGKNQWNGKIYGNEKYGYRIYVDNKEHSITAEDVKTLKDFQTEEKEKSLKEKTNRDKKSTKDYIVRKLVNKMNNLEIDKLNSNIEKIKNDPKKFIKLLTHYITKLEENASNKVTRHLSILSEPGKHHFKQILDNMENESTDLINMVIEKIEKLKNEKEYNEKMATDKDFRESENKKIADKNKDIANKNKKQSERIKEIAGEGYWNGKIYGSAKNGYTVYVANKKYTIPEKDYELFDLQKS